METKKICVRADEAFFHKKENMPVLDAMELINQNQRDGLAKRKAWLEEIEYQATAEISNDGKRIIQFYADEFDRNNCLPSEEIKAAFQKWLNLKKPRNQSKKQKEVA